MIEGLSIRRLDAARIALAVVNDRGHIMRIDAFHYGSRIQTPKNVSVHN